MLAEDVKFCPRCGTALEEKERAGKKRPVCPACNWVFFPDPKVAVAAVVQRDGEVLLVQRAHHPFRGRWMLPAGFVDAGEDPEKAALREVLEETNLKAGIKELLMVLSGQEYEKGAHILIVYCAEILKGELVAGDDALNADFFNLDALPPLAFSSTKSILSAL
ncbi:MAG: NUDIX hydrolase [Anaerolineales bacterium]